MIAGGYIKLSNAVRALTGYTSSSSGMERVGRFAAELAQAGKEDGSPSLARAGLRLRSWSGRFAGASRFGSQAPKFPSRAEATANLLEVVYAADRELGGELFANLIHDLTGTVLHIEGLYVEKKKG